MMRMERKFTCPELLLPSRHPKIVGPLISEEGCAREMVDITASGITEKGGRRGGEGGLGSILGVPIMWHSLQSGSEVVRVTGECMAVGRAELE